MGYNNVMPSWMLEELLEKQRKQDQQQKKVKLRLRIIVGSVEYVKKLSADYWHTPIWKLNLQQSEPDSEQYLLSKGFKKL